MGDGRDDEAADAADRGESAIQRLDRNWTELLQELRVVQTGVQVLTGFLLTLPFQQRFDTVGHGERAVYLTAVVAAILATGFLQTPVSVHRALFQRHRRRETVLLAHRLTIIGLVFLAIAVVAVTTLIFDVILGGAAGAVAGSLAGILLLVLWLVIPLRARRRTAR